MAKNAREDRRLILKVLLDMERWTFFFLSFFPSSFLFLALCKVAHWQCVCLSVCLSTGASLQEDDPRQSGGGGDGDGDGLGGDMVHEVVG